MSEKPAAVEIDLTQRPASTVALPDIIACGLYHEINTSPQQPWAMLLFCRGEIHSSPEGYTHVYTLHDTTTYIHLYRHDAFDVSDVINSNATDLFVYLRDKREINDEQKHEELVQWFRHEFVVIPYGLDSSLGGDLEEFCIRCYIQRCIRRWIYLNMGGQESDQSIAMRIYKIPKEIDDATYRLIQKNVAFAWLYIPCASCIRQLRTTDNQQLSAAGRVFMNAYSVAAIKNNTNSQ